MKTIKKILAVALVIMSVMAVAIPAMASSSVNVVPGVSKKGTTIVKTAGSYVSYTVSATLKAGDSISVFLDVFNPERNMWVKRSSCVLSAGSSAGKVDEILSYQLDSNETQVRIRTYGYQGNSGTIPVFYN